MYFRSGGLAVLAFVVACSATPVSNDAAVVSEPRVATILDGAFTVDQAERGRLVYDTHCASCHPTEFYEAQLLIWQGATVDELLAALRATMPSENPGMLPTSEYLDVLAYIFSITGSPAGAAELTVESAGSVRIVSD